MKRVAMVVSEKAAATATNVETHVLVFCANQGNVDIRFESLANKLILTA